MMTYKIWCNRRWLKVTADIYRMWNGRKRMSYRSHFYVWPRREALWFWDYTPVNFDLAIDRGFDCDKRLS